jgi:hypothetical protein
VYGPLPLVTPAEDQQRIVESWRLRQMLEGTWRPLLAEHGWRQLGPARAALVGEWDTSANLFSSVIDQTSTMYDTQPQIGGGTTAVLDDSFQRGGWWQMARQHMRYVKGLRESAVFVGWDSDLGHPTFSLVTPDLLTVETAPTNRSRPVTIWRADQRPIPGRPSEKAWFWFRWSIASGVGSYSVWTADRQRDVTAAFADPGAWEGASYPYRDEQGNPVLPAVLYHSAGQGNGVWHPHQHQEIAFGTLQVGLMWTGMVHGFLRAGWDQRWIANARVRGGATAKAGDHPVRLITPDPTAVLELEGTGSGNVEVGAWGASIDIVAAEQTVRYYQNGLAVHFDLSPSDVAIESLSPASGASITVSQAGKRRVALRDLVHFRLGDVQLAEVVAAVNRGWGVSCSAKGFRARYAGVALTADERKTVDEWIGQEMDRGLMDRAMAYQELHPGTDLDDAQADILALDTRKQMEQLRAQTLAALAGTAQDAAPDGRQTASLLQIIEDVGAGLLPRDAGLALVQWAGAVNPETAAKLLGSAGTPAFQPTTPPPPPAPIHVLPGPGLGGGPPPGPPGR